MLCRLVCPRVVGFVGVLLPRRAWPNSTTIARTPTVPVGWTPTDNGQVPYQRIGVRGTCVALRPHGRKSRGDASHYLYAEPGDVTDTWSVPLTKSARGASTSSAPITGTAAWNYEVDGRRQIVEDTPRPNPVGAKGGLRRARSCRGPVSKPLTWTWSTTRGANLMWVPLEFEKSCGSSTAGRARNGLFHLSSLRLPTMKHLSHPLHRGQDAPCQRCPRPAPPSRRRMSAPGRGRRQDGGDADLKTV